MTESLTKRCTKCGIVKPREDFCKDGRYKDGLQAWCKDCTNTYKAKQRLERKTSPKPTVKGVKLAKKAIDMVEALPSNKYSMRKAYKAVTGCKEKPSLSMDVKHFWDNVGEDEVALDMFRRYLINDTKDIALKSAFTQYFQRAMTEGSLGEQNSALNLTFKVMGWLEKRGVSTDKPKIKTPEQRAQERAEYLKSMEEAN